MQPSRAGLLLAMTVHLKLRGRLLSQGLVQRIGAALGTTPSEAHQPLLALLDLAIDGASQSATASRIQLRVEMGEALGSCR